MKDLKQRMYNRKSIQFKSKNSSKTQINKSKRIAFLVDGRSDISLKILNQYIKKLEAKGKYVSLLFMTDHAEPEKISFQAFNKKSFTWYNIPKAQVIIDFITKDYDMLICFNENHLEQIDAIVDLSNAKFKIGVINGNNECFDLVINPVREECWADYIKTLENTLDQLSVREPAYA